MTETTDTAVQTLPVMEAFYTLQGEGFHQGKAAYFIRLAGCDVGCVWCDVKESWDVSAHPRKPIPEIVSEAQHHPARIAVITGGEPLMHDCAPLTEQLKIRGFQTHVETSGAYPLSGSWDWICLSPKKFRAPRPELLLKAHELKVVIYHPSDFAWAEKHAALVGPRCKLFLQPEWSRREQITPLITQYILENPAWEFSLQLHKYIQVP
ncbi:MAG: 7-carboxy-7-deazaguanine synthase QueE [Bacteroidota bacterium]|nr:7-carboxy-7-deazaguanine synthase QueE [Bacteroidota bacterium]MDP4211960.1 7-carboxy-7-deazaguanine synthase QueE [Bacteroidota bacterium]MDP4250082.1 7-carboxy-7-deazaguanine synthase QueE [Bacteroidota bacterium]